MARVVPVFILNNQLPAFDEKPFTTAEICSAVEKISGFESVEGAQRIGGLWRIYPRTVEVRNKILIQGFNIRKVLVEVKDKNPFVVHSPDGEEREIPATKLTISNIPLSFSDDDIFHAVKNLKINVRSKLIAERDRDSNGKLTRWKTGRRFLYVDVPPVPLPKFLEIGPFRASIFHKEQKQMKAECSKCLGKGHRSSACDHPVKCRQCLKDGHKAGDPICDMTPPVQRENSRRRKNSSCDSTGKSTNRASTFPRRTSASRSPVRGATCEQQPSNPSSSSDSAKPRRPSRGRPWQTKTVKKGHKGQSILNFPSETSRSASAKRPRPEDSTPPQHHDKHSRQEQPNMSGSDDEFSDVLPV